MKYKGFTIGEKLPPENIDSIDPANITPQSAGYLTGGNSPSALSVFQALREANDDGKISIDINGTLHQNVACPLDDYSSSHSDYVDVYTPYSFNGNAYAVYINPNFTFKMDLFKFLSASSSPLSISIYSGKQHDFSGTPIQTITSTVSSHSSGKYLHTLTINTPIKIKANNGYSFVCATQSFALGNSGGSTNQWNENWTNQWSGYYPSIIYVGGYSQLVLSSLSDVATAIQTAIRALTGKTETVVYDTNHFKITSSITGLASKVLKLISPSSGTDITGNATEKYLDLGANATETFGQGDDYHLLRLGSDGLIPQGLVKTLQNQTATAKALNTVYQNTTTKTKLIVVSIGIQAASNQAIDVQSLIGPTSTPTMMISKLRDGGSSYTERMTLPLIILVPAGWYYKILTSGSYSSTPAIDGWFESDFI